jgi:hypothetical protein
MFKTIVKYVRCYVFVIPFVISFESNREVCEMICAIFVCFTIVISFESNREVCEMLLFVYLYCHCAYLFCPSLIPICH